MNGMVFLRRLSGKVSEVMGEDKRSLRVIHNLECAGRATLVCVVGPKLLTLSCPRLGECGDPGLSDTPGHFGLQLTRTISARP